MQTLPQTGTDPTPWAQASENPIDPGPEGEPCPACDVAQSLSDRVASIRSDRDLPARAAGGRLDTCAGLIGHLIRLSNRMCRKQDSVGRVLRHPEKLQLCGDPKGLLDEAYLPNNIALAQPSHLAFANHVHGFGPGDRPECPSTDRNHRLAAMRFFTNR